LSQQLGYIFQTHTLTIEQYSCFAIAVSPPGNSYLGKSIGSQPSLLSNTMDAEAMLARGRCSEPANIISSVFFTAQ